MTDKQSLDNWTTFASALIILVPSAFIIGFTIMMINEKVNTRVIKTSTEVHVIEVLKIHPPKHFRIAYFDHTTKQLIELGSKHCGDFTKDKYEVGHKYQVALRFETTQYKEDPPKRFLTTGGCDLYSQQPKTY